jgi:hypothetical protein
MVMVKHKNGKRCSKSFLPGGISALCRAWKTKRPGWELTGPDLRLIRSCLGKLAKDKAILTNRERKKPHYITLRDAAIIIRRYMVSVLTCRDKSFTHDRFFSSLLMISLLPCIGARGGDLAWSREGEPDQTLQFQEKELSLDPGGVSLANVTLRIRITNYKGNLGGRGAAQKHTIRRSQRKENFMLDTIVLMIRDFRKLGLFLRSIEEILETAKAHPRRLIVVGTDEDATRPVLLDLKRSQNYEDPDGDEQALGQRRITTKKKDLCHIAGVTVPKRFSTHAFRRGTASDLSRLPGDTWRLVASVDISNLLGHHNGKGRNKLAETYADASTEEASRARESDLPLLRPNDDDGTT